MNEFCNVKLRETNDQQGGSLTDFKALKGT